MISAQEENYILDMAYIPEHSVRLMTLVSNGEPFLIQDHFCCRREDWVIIVGYPLQGHFFVRKLEEVITRVTQQFHPRYTSLIAPEIPPSFMASCRERESDYYYTLNLQKPSLKNSLVRKAERAVEQLTVERTQLMNKFHDGLTLEFVERVTPPPRVRELYLRMPDYVCHCPHALVLNAWDKEGRLAAYYVLDLAPREFSIYVTGCHSKKHYVPGASDLLFLEMVKVSMERDKKFIHLGLGVNRGIRQFKKKWGGTATRKYEMCEIESKRFSLWEILSAFR